MNRNESFITILAVAIGLSASLAIIFFNFSLVFSLKLLQTGSVATGRYLFSVLITVVNSALVFWFIKSFKVSRGESLESIHEEALAKLNETKRKSVFEEKELSKKIILSVANSQQPFSSQEIMDLTGLDRVETEYLLDELILNDTLRVKLIDDNFYYQLAKQEILLKES